MSKFIVSARKYRPAAFDEVIGQDHVAKTLKNALIQDKLAHAFLFCGPRGVGKTTCARILAKVINCTNKIDGVDPCNECTSCKSFSDNASFNIIELDAASNNSVESIRTLIEQVRFQPQQGSHKVFIIDEVHMLSTAAFNAFLKTLEEPPPYAIFILATTEKHKILPTILSRCQIFDFKRIQISHIVQQLQHICKVENRNAELDALQMIAQKADGAMRDALSIYDKIASAAGDNITYQDVIQQLNILDYDYFFRMTDYLLREDFTQLLLTLDEVMKQGFEVDLFIQGMAEHLRNLMVCRHPDTLSILDLSEAAMKRYHDQALICSHSFLLSALNILNQCDISLSTATNKRLYAEIALSKICYLNRAIDANLISGSIEKKTPVSNSSINAETPSKPDAPVTNSPITKNSESTFNDPPREVTSNESSFQDAPSRPTTLSAEPKTEEPKQPEPQATPLVEETIESRVESESTPVEALKETGANEEVSNTVQESVEQADGIAESIASKSADVVNTPSFNSIEALLSQVKKEEEVKKEARRTMSIEAVDSVWNKYYDDHTSPSVKVALKNSHRSLIDGKVIVAVSSENTKNIILQEDDLKDLLRAKLGAEDLIMEIEVDKARFPEVKQEKPKVLYNTKEKYLLMQEKNPLIDELKTRFDLKADK